MNDVAFLGDPAIKAQAQARLRRHIADGTFVIFPAWEDGKANIIGALVEADDKQAFVDRYGYPVAIANALEIIANAFKTVPAAAEFAETLLERTPVGADLSRVVPRLLVHILGREEIVALTAPHAEVERCRRAVTALHQRTIDGEQPDRKEWKVVRLAALAASDALAEGSMVRFASLIVEAAAWPATMRTVMLDTLGACGRLESQQMIESIGWTEADESRVFKIRDQAEVDGRMADLQGLARVLALLDHDDPELARGFRERLEHFAKLGDAYRTVGLTLVDLCEKAPIVAAAGTASA